MEMKSKLSAITLALIISAAFAGCEMSGNTSDSIDTQAIQTAASTEVESADSIAVSEEAEAVSETESETEEAQEETYTSNQYFDVVETGTYKNSIGYTHIIHKVLAKQSVAVSGTVIAYDENNAIIGKSSSDITLTEGDYNFFEYSFDGDVSNANLQVTANTKSSSIFDGDADAVELEAWNVSGSDLYLTLNQVKEDLGGFAQFKLLYYKDGEIVHTDTGYFSIYAKNLNGVGTSDVASVSVYGFEFDDLEYIYEP